MSPFRRVLETWIRERACMPALRAEVPFAEAMQTMYDARYTGAVVLHFHEGAPTALHVPREFEVCIDTGVAVR